MKKTRKVLLALLSVLTAASFSLGIAACGAIQPVPPVTDSSSSQTVDNGFQRVYAMYVEYAQAQGRRLFPTNYG